MNAFYHKFNKDVDLNDVLKMDLREMDKKVLYAFSTHALWIDALMHCLQSSNDAYVIRLEDDTVVGVFGVKHFKDYSVPWILTSKEIYKCTRDLLKGAPEVLKKMTIPGKALVNVGLTEDTGAISFVKHLGFTVEPYGDGTYYTCKKYNE